MKRVLLPALAIVLLAAPGARAETRLEKAFPLSPGGSLRLDTDMGGVTVAGSAQSGARIVVTSRRRPIEDLLDLRFEPSASGLVVTAKRRHRGWFEGSEGVHFEVTVPARTRVDVHTSGGGVELSGTRGDARLRTSGGGLEIRDFAGRLDAGTSGGGIRLDQLKGDIRVRTSGGGIRAEGIAGPLDAETSGGGIELSRISGDLRAESSGGPIRVDAAGGRVEASTSGGRVEVSFDKGNARGGRVSSSGGDVEVSLDPGVNLTIDARGDAIHSDLPLGVETEIGRRRLRGRLGRGGTLLELRSSGGSVRIRAD
jgi:hypothetical protein